MTRSTFQIVGGDFAAGGAASRKLKALLQEVGTEAAAVRRAMVAAYEAEMNAVIHAGDAEMRVALAPDELEVVVADQGPGIPDVQRAMTEGFSTAPAEARELGFGAGMGLPNIRKNTDLFTIRSAPGQGTRVRFVIQLKAAGAPAQEDLTPWVGAAACVQCGRCVRACPTGAIRLYGRAPLVLTHQCIGCNACAAVCPAGVFQPCAPGTRGTPGGDVVLATPFAGQSAGGDAAALADAAGVPAERLHWSLAWERALLDAAVAHAETAESQPVLAPVCPAVVALIRLRFPALLGCVAPFHPPLEAAREDLEADELTAAPLCPAQARGMAPGPMTPLRMVHPAGFVRKLEQVDRHAPPTAFDPEPRARSLEITGLGPVLRFLERLEAGLLAGRGVVALYACPGGCHGAPVLPEVPGVARLRTAARLDTPPAHAVHRTRAWAPRTGERLDDDMAAAIEKLGRVDVLVRTLPGYDCAACGAPTCAAFATDVIKERTTRTRCPYRGREARGTAAGAGAPQPGKEGDA